MVHSGAIWNGVLEVGTAEKSLKAWKLNGAFWCYLKRCNGSWNCWEKFESMEAKWCILALFEECFRWLSEELFNVDIVMFITEITHNKTIRYHVKLLTSSCFCYYFQHSLLNTPVYLQTLKDMTYSLNCISVLLCTQSVYFVWAVVMGVTSLADFHSTSFQTISFNRTYCLRHQPF